MTGVGVDGAAFGVPLLHPAVQPGFTDPSETIAMTVNDETPLRNSRRPFERPHAIAIKHLFRNIHLLHTSKPGRQNQYSQTETSSEPMTAVAAMP
jgi:hypothetical protein